MPRTRKTLSGAPAQPISPVAGQMYGAGVDQMEMQRQMPAPQVAPPPPGDVPRGTSAPGAQMAATNAEARQGVEVERAGLDKTQVLELAKGLRDKMGLLTQPTRRPHEPVTAGLPSGPGRGPEVLATVRGTPTGDTLRRIAALTGDAELARIAERARI